MRVIGFCRFFSKLGGYKKWQEVGGGVELCGFELKMGRIAEMDCLI